jgi:hypothetical protein
MQAIVYPLIRFDVASHHLTVRDREVGGSNPLAPIAAKRQ